MQLRLECVRSTTTTSTTSGPSGGSGGNGGAKGGTAGNGGDGGECMPDGGAPSATFSTPTEHKTMRLLHQKLAPHGIYVGEVTVLGTVKGTVFDSGKSTLEPSTIADAFWKIYQERTPLVTPIS